MRLNLQRQIRAYINHQCQHCQSRRSTRFLRLSLLAWLPILSLSPALRAQIDEHYEWDCQPTKNGSGWTCAEIATEGPGYQRPSHGTPGESSVAAGNKFARSKHALDWVPAEELTAAEKAELPSGCCGAYVEPERTDPSAHLDPAEAPLQASSDKARATGETTYIMEGNVKLTQGTRQLQADKAILDRTTNEAEITGDIELREPGVLLRSTKATMNLHSRHAVLDDAVFVMHNTRSRGSAEKIEHMDNNLLVLENGSYTSCEPDSDIWVLKGREIVLDPNYEQGEGRDVRLEVKGVPVFYAPYLLFPISDKRQSGLLFPYISTSDSGGGGVNVGLPYYFNLAPNYDMTLTPRHIDDRGEMLELEYRHLTPHFETLVNMAHLGNDDGGSDDDDEERVERARAELAEDPTNATLQSRLERLEAKVGESIGEDRWLLNIDQTGGLGARWGTQIDFTRVSDSDYFRDLDTASLSVNSQTHLKRLGQLNYQFENWLLSAKAEEYQTISDTILDINQPYRQTPRINADGSYRFGDWVLELNNEFVSFDHREKESKVTGDRARFDYRAAWEKDWVWGFFKPALLLKHVSYQLDDDFDHGIEDDPEISVPQGALDMGLFFERDGSLFGSAYLQTFEPRLFYFYSDFEDQSELTALKFDTTELTGSYSQLFRDSRFSGGDRIDDANQLSVGLTTRIIETETGIERLGLSVGQIYHFADRRVILNQPRLTGDGDDPRTVNRSEIAARVTARLDSYWRLNSELLYDENQQAMSRGNMSLKYMDDEFRLFNIGYRYLRQAGQPDSSDIDNDGDVEEIIAKDIDQAEASVLWPILGNWSLIGRYNKDFTNDRELETFAGLEFNSCCYRVRAVWRRWLDNDLIDIVDDRELDFDEGVFFEFQFKGLGGTGATIDSVLSEGIEGYDQREQYLK